MHTLLRRRLPCRAQTRAPFLRWTDWPGSEVAAAVGTDVGESGLGTGGAKGAFVGADACFCGRWGEVFVAVFAVGA